MNRPKGKSVEIKSVYSNAYKLIIDTQYAHDMWINTETTDIEHGDFSTGRQVRIYSYYGSKLFADLNEQFNKTLLDDVDMNKFDITTAPEIDLKKMEHVALIDYIADQSRLDIYRNDAGLIGMQTGHTKLDEWHGPIVWVCGDKKNDITDTHKKRREIFEPIFELTKYVADRFNRSPELN